MPTSTCTLVGAYCSPPIPQHRDIFVSDFRKIPPPPLPVRCYKKRLANFLLDVSKDLDMRICHVLVQPDLKYIVSWNFTEAVCQHAICGLYKQNEKKKKTGRNSTFIRRAFYLSVNVALTFSRCGTANISLHLSFI